MLVRVVELTDAPQEVRVVPRPSSGERLHKQDLLYRSRRDMPQRALADRVVPVVLTFDDGELDATLVPFGERRDAVACTSCASATAG
jgi:hypothetical protein